VKFSVQRSSLCEPVPVDASSLTMCSSRRRSAIGVELSAGARNRRSAADGRRRRAMGAPVRSLRSLNEGREAQCNLEVIWLTGRLTPDFKTIADFRRDNGSAIMAVCSQFVALCRRLGLLTQTVVAIDGSKFKAVNNHDKNYTVTKVKKRMEQVDASIARYPGALDRADREEGDLGEAKANRLKEKIAGLRRQMQCDDDIGGQRIHRDVAQAPGQASSAGEA